MISIGLMSGTSMDGIDAALLETDGGASTIKDLGYTSFSYDAEFKILLKAAEYTVKKCYGNMLQAELYFEQALREYLANELMLVDDQLNNKLAALSSYFLAVHFQHLPISLPAIIQHSTYLHALVVAQLLKVTSYKASQIDVIGYHGQTLFHRPVNKISVVIGDGQFLANQSGIKVVNDFRSADVAAGGQGAPFAPLYHQALAIRDNKIPLVVINCGGIANLTMINNANELNVIGFDTGPGNGLLDRFVHQRTKGQEFMDSDGRYGKAGNVNAAVLEALYQKAIIKDNNNYFDQAPPKSLDIGDMELIPELDSLSLEDGCATLAAFTADTIINSLKFLASDAPPYWILSGGGWNNPLIRSEFEQRLTKKLGNTIQILSADQAGWNSQAMEAQIFAYLAVRILQHKPISFPNITGVPEPLSGGQVYLPI